MTSASDLVARADEPAFAVDEHGVIVAWNDPLARLLGRAGSEVLGKQCYDVVCGRDVFGNRFCQPDCTVAAMAQLSEPVRHFELEVQCASGDRTWVWVSVMVTHDRSPDRFTIIHLLQPVEKQLQDCGPPLAQRTPRYPPSPASLEDANQTPALSRRETEILRLLDQGATTTEIAGHLFISVKTVRNHIQNIFHKLGTHNRLETVCAARGKSHA